MTCADHRVRMLETLPAEWDAGHLARCPACGALAARIRAVDAEARAAVVDFVDRDGFDEAFARATAVEPRWSRTRAALIAVLAALTLLLALPAVRDLDLVASASSMLRRPPPVEVVQVHRSHSAHLELGRGWAGWVGPSGARPPPEEKLPVAFAVGLPRRPSRGNVALVVGRFLGTRTIDLVDDQGRNFPLRVEVLPEDVPLARPSAPWIHNQVDDEVALVVGERVDLAVRPGVPFVVQSADDIYAKADGGDTWATVKGVWPGRTDVVVVYDDGVVTRTAVTVWPVDTTSPAR